MCLCWPFKGKHIYCYLEEIDLIVLEAFLWTGAWIFYEVGGSGSAKIARFEMGSRYFRKIPPGQAAGRLSG